MYPLRVVHCRGQYSLSFGYTALSGLQINLIHQPGVLRRGGHSRTPPQAAGTAPFHGCKFRNLSGFFLKD